MRSRLIMTLCAVFMLSSSAFPAMPASITVQGKLTDSTGVALPAGAKTFTFRVFDAQSFGTQIWPAVGGEIQSITSGADGLWVGLLGAISPLYDAVFSDTSAWLEIDVDGTTLPRVRLVTGPYAFRVATVDGATGGTITSKVSIGPGHTNTGSVAFVAGRDNTATGDLAAIGGGRFNVADGNASTIGGGYNSVTPGDNATVGGGYENSAAGLASAIGGGVSNYASGILATIGGGGNNKARGQYSFVGGGGGADPIDSNAAVGGRSVVGGGAGNIAAGDSSVITGGADNVAGGSISAIGGGRSNVASGRGSVVCGGGNNRARGLFSFVGGGGNVAAVDSNAAVGDWSMVPGGVANLASGDCAFAAGVRAKAKHNGSFVWGDFTPSDFASTAVNQFLIRANGGVGIGTNAPEAPLHVLESSAGSVTANTSSIAVFERGGNGYLSVLTPDANERGILFGEPSDPAAGGIVYNNGSTLDGLQFRTNGNSTKMVLDSLGRVGIGINTPEAPLHVMDVNVAGISGSPNASAVFERNGENWIHMLTPDGQQCGILFGISGNSLMGSIRFNAGNNRGFDFRASNNTSRLILDSLGNLTADGCVVGSNIACPSDARFKRNIETLPNALGVVEKLRGVRYEWRSEDFPDRDFVKGEQVGLVAQEVREVVPQAVIEQSDGYLAVDYARLVPLLIESIKEQQKHIEALEAKLEHQTP